MIVAMQEDADILILMLRGQLDGTTVASAEPDMMKAAALRRGTVLDLSELTYVASVGLRLIILLAKRLSQSGQRLALCGLQPQVEEVFEIGGFTSLLSLLGTRRDAIAFVQGQEGPAQ